MPPKLPLPRGWKDRVRSSVLQIVALSHYTLTEVRRKDQNSQETPLVSIIPISDTASYNADRVERSLYCLSALLFGVPPNDPATFAGALALISGVAVLASWLPVRSASRTDPRAVLRNE